MKTKPLRRRLLPSLVTLRQTIRLSLLALFGSVVSLTPLHANVIFTFQEDDNDVVATTSGSIASGWTVTSPSSTTATEALLTNTAIRYAKDGVTSFDNNAGNWTYTALGGEFRYKVGVAAGDAFGYSGDTTFYAPEGTNVGDAFTPNTTMTWAGETFASLGLDTALSTTPLTLFTLDNGSTISGALIPEPSSYGFLLGAVGLATAIFCRRRRARTD